MELIRKKKVLQEFMKTVKFQTTRPMISNISYWMEMLMLAQPLSCPQGLP